MATESLAELKRQSRKVKREHETAMWELDWSLSQSLRSRVRLKPEPIDRESHPPKPLARRDSPLLKIQEEALSALATGRLNRPEVFEFVNDEVSMLTISEALDIYEGLASLDDEDANVALVERMFKAAQRGKGGNRTIDVAGASLRLARLLLTGYVTNWASSIVEGTVPEPPTRKVSRNR